MRRLFALALGAALCAIAPPSLASQEVILYAHSMTIDDAGNYAVPGGPATGRIAGMANASVADNAATRTTNSLSSKANASETVLVGGAYTAKKNHAVPGGAATGRHIYPVS